MISITKVIFTMLLILGNNSYWQKEYLLAKPARDAAAKAKMEAEASSSAEGPLHLDNEWDIRCFC